MSFDQKTYNALWRKNNPNKVREQGQRRYIKHLDLFSGIGGFAYAADQVWDDVEHTFVEFDPFCQQVLKKHWPEAKIYGDIRQFTPNTVSPTSRRKDSRNTNNEGRKTSKDRRKGLQPKDRQTHANHHKPSPTVDLLTGGFPCQPFSAAGLRRGTADDRHLWPEMLRVIRLAKPQWVIAENVGGILSWNEGMVFEQVCTDMEAAGYTVQPFVIPAVAVNAPHRRDRVWFIGHAEHDGQYGAKDPEGNTKGSDRNPERPDELRQPKGADSLREDATNTPNRRRGKRSRDNGTPNWHGVEGETQKGDNQGSESTRRYSSPEWNQDWSEIATRLCSVDDGLPGWMGDTTISKSRHRKEQLKAYGNAIVPQVAVEIMRGVRLAAASPPKTTKNKIRSRDE